MKKLVAAAALLVVMTGIAAAKGSFRAPELDPSVGLTAVTLLFGALAALRARNGRL
ncbi:MAG: hypothetical protein WB440_04900 [Steroidobacteraceae bacterium]|jgi:hypothetical protein